jgi:O-antigen ligase
MELINKRAKTLSSWWLMVSILLLAIAYSIDYIRPAMYSKMLAIQLSSLLLTLTIFFAYKNKRFEINFSPIPIAYVLLLISILPSIFLSVNIGRSLSEFMKIFQFFMVYSLVLLLFNKFNLKKVFLRAIVVFVAISLCVALFQFLVLYSESFASAWQVMAQKYFGALPTSDDLHQQSYFIKSLFAHRNLFTHLILLCAPFLFAAFISEKGFWRWFALCLLLLCSIPLVLLFVRSIWLIAGLSIFVGLLLILVSSSRKLFLKGKWTIIIVLTLLGIASLLIGIQKQEEVKTTFKKQTYWMSDATFGSANERLSLWKSTLPMIEDNFWFGVGPNNWSLVIPRYQNKELRTTIEGTFTQFQRAHNDFLQIWSEQGLVSFLLYLLLFGIALMVLLIGIFKETDPKKNVWLISLFLFLLIYLGIAFFSFPKERIEHQFLLAIVLVFISTLPSQRVLTAVNAKLVLALMYVFQLPLLIHTMHMLESDKMTLKAYEYRAQGDAKQFDYFEEANSFFNPIDPNGTPFDWYLSFEYAALGNYQMAEKHLHKSLEQHPYHKHTFNDLGSVYFQTKGKELARHQYKKALALEPRFVDANVNIAILLIQDSEFDEAWERLSMCDTNNYHQYYKPAVSEACRYIVGDLIEELQSKDSLLASTVNRIQESTDWMWTTHKHAIENFRSFRQQLIEESLYVLHNMENIISEAEVRRDF